jgi:hypothetical protein
MFVATLAATVDGA